MSRWVHRKKGGCEDESVLCLCCACFVVGFGWSLTSSFHAADLVDVFSTMPWLYSTYSTQSNDRYTLSRANFIISAVVVIVVCFVGDSVPPGGSSPLAN
jgi:hypothetical protein